MMSQLQAGYDAYIELQGNLAEGTKFYNNLTKILTAYQSNVNDFVLARNTEKDDLMKLVCGQVGGNLKGIKLVGISVYGVLICE